MRKIISEQGAGAAMNLSTRLCRKLLAQSRGTTERLDQQAFRLPDGAGLGVPLVEPLLRTQLDATNRIPPTKQQWAVAPGLVSEDLTLTNHPGAT